MTTAANQDVLLDYDGPVATLRLNRPERRNALTYPMLAQFRDRLDEVAASDARVLILRGEGRDFCVDFFRMDFAGLPDLRFATFFPPFLVIRQCPRRSQRVAESIACAIEKNERRITPLATGHSGTETG